ncbi:thioesterase domain-containing protein [Aspergillus ibericus CBS 121593]|uniref:Alpha/beta-hydrolase n=1 Tax=Aspergillus ibericus CBS 121593 TaxID=1448316 RepID=A0A395H7Z9_9EURO|nr:alpha/beta-hydrolase [Aspergillus ibericus CBS 121593]RAL03689.1 alpha/beta-hydrolase [Aspergillus ibericus CBS 121593]
MLFLLFDGSRSCLSYTTLSTVNLAMAVVSINYLFMKTPELYTCGINDICTVYIREIRQRQPHGPYALGGWSVGSIFAFHIAKQLISAGESITDLVLIDCPVPRGLDHLPRRYFEYCEQVGLLGTVNGVRRDPPPWLIPHFEACINSLHPYHATPIEPSCEAPRTQIIWAGDAVDRHLEPKFERRPDDPEGLKFLTEARTDFGPCGWESLVPRTKMDIARIVDANHFSMMQGDAARQLAAVMRRFLMDAK